jgi:hypothetical protein
MKDVCKEKWDADFIDKIGENRQQLYDLILVRPRNFCSPPHKHSLPSTPDIQHALPSIYRQH